MARGFFPDGPDFALGRIPDASGAGLMALLGKQAKSNGLRNDDISVKAKAGALKNGKRLVEAMIVENAHEVQQPSLKQIKH